MAVRRKPNFGAESARRQLMQPVSLWEKAWVPAENAPATIKVYKWVRTDKDQHFSDDEGTVDEPLVPLPDEPEVVEGDEEEQDENNAAPAESQPEPQAAQEQPEEHEEPENSKQSSPKLTMTLQMDDTPENDVLDASLKPGLDGIEEKIDDQGGIELDMSGLGPDGIQMEEAHDLTQLDDNPLMAGPLLDQSVDPFATE